MFFFVPGDSEFRSPVKSNPWLETQYSPRLRNVAEPILLDHFLDLAPAHDGRPAGDPGETFCKKGHSKEHRFGEMKIQWAYRHRLREDVAYFLHSIVMAVRQKKDFPALSPGLGRQQDRPDEILDMAHADVLIMIGVTRFDAPGEALAKRVKTFIPGSIDGTGPQDEERELMGAGQGQFLPQQFAFPIGRDRFARVRFFFLLIAPARTRCRLARNIDKFLNPSFRSF